ncbi:MAG: Na/Pi cotransporter family protein [Clostridia bacterium]|nr:Na/Pi cotransporter family protein [Clostridia bacterium]
MNFFDVLSLLGGLAMFLYGMRLMGDSLKENSSGTLKKVMEKVTDNALKAFVLGIAVTALIQSSTATIVITSGLVGAGILSLRQSLGIIVGANVGTTVTGQIIRLLDLNASETSVLRFFQPSTLAPIALIIGILLIMTGILKNSRSIGNIAIGFGILFSGLLNMTSAVNALQKSGIVEQVFSGLGDNPFLGYIAGAGVAFVLQSSSAAVGILQAFSAGGLLTFKAIYSVIVGIYLGDCVTTAIVIYIGANRESKRVAIVNILYNLGKSIMVLVVITIIHQIGLLNGLWDAVVNSGMIANTNTVFNLVCAICLLPMIRVFERMSDRIVKNKKEEKDPHGELIKGLNPVFFATPAIALQSCYDVLQKMLQLSRNNLERAQKQLEEYSAPLQEEIAAEEMQVDRLTDNLSRYLVELLPHLQSEDHISVLNQYYKLSTEFERLGDQAVNIADIAAKLSDNNTDFSETFKKEIAVLQELIRDILDDAERAFTEQSEKASSMIEPKVHVVSDLIDEMTQNHFARMSAGECSMLADAVFSNLMAEYKRIAGTCSNTGMAVLVSIHPELASREHLFLETLDKSGNAEYRTVLEQTHKKYFDQLNAAENTPQYQQLEITLDDPAGASLPDTTP